MKSVAATPVVASKATDSPVVEVHGARIPLIGLGTWNLRGSTCARMVEQALRLGYRHVDTAEMYDNEREVGAGLRASGLARCQVFIGGGDGGNCGAGAARWAYRRLCLFGIAQLGLMAG